MSACRSRDSPACRHGAGINDDLNKAVWAALNLEPELSVEEIVGQYARLHFGAEHEAAMTQVLLGLEENWGGDREPEHFLLEFYAFVCSPPDAARFCAFCAVVDNASIEATLAAVNSVLAASGPAALKDN